MRSGNLFVISGPSGAGKGTLVARLLSKVPDTWASVSYTTRDPRKGEIDGISYFFVDRDTFIDMVEADEFLEWAEYSENCYGTPWKHVTEHLDKGDQVVLEIDVQGAFQIREKVPDAKLVFIEPPSFEELERRLRSRMTEDEDVVRTRLEAAKVELSVKDEYDIRIVNDDLDKATEELIAYVNDQAEGTRG